MTSRFLALYLMLAPTIAFAQPKPAPSYTYAQALSSASDDAVSSKDGASSYRYLMIQGKWEAEHLKMGAAIDFAMNGFGRGAVLIPATRLDDGRLLRVDLGAYTSAKNRTAETKALIDAWDDLCTKGSGPVRIAAKIDLPEPYFHQQALSLTVEYKDKFIDTEPYIGKDGKRYHGRWEKEKVGVKEERVVTYSDFLTGQKYADLVSACKTDYPIVRADWFIANVLLPPAYYNFLGAKTLADYDKLVRYSQAFSEELEIHGIATKSREVAHHNRAALRSQTATRARWETFDYAHSVQENKLLQNILLQFENRRDSKKKIKVRDAGEFISFLPNGLLAYFLTAGANDDRIDFADPHVAEDRNTGWEYKLVYTGFSCISCHKEGFKPFNEAVRLLTDITKKKAPLLVEDPKDYAVVQSVFGRDQALAIKQDQTAYDLAVQAVSSYFLPKPLTATEMHSLIEKIVIEYRQGDILLADAALELDCTDPAKFRAALDGVKKLNNNAALMVGGEPVRRDQWEEVVFAQFMRVLNGPKRAPRRRRRTRDRSGNVASQRRPVLRDRLQHLSPRPRADRQEKDRRGSADSHQQLHGCCGAC